MSSKALSSLDFQLPSNWIGQALQGQAKNRFLSLRNKIDRYNHEPVTTDCIVGILDMIEDVKTLGYNRSIPVLNEVVHYLRAQLMHKDSDIVFHTLILLDCIVKNSGFILHINNSHGCGYCVI